MFALLTEVGGKGMAHLSRAEFLAMATELHRAMGTQGGLLTRAGARWAAEHVGLCLVAWQMTEESRNNWIVRIPRENGWTLPEGTFFRMKYFLAHYRFTHAGAKIFRRSLSPLHAQLGVGPVLYRHLITDLDQRDYWQG